MPATGRAVAWRPRPGAGRSGAAAAWAFSAVPMQTLGVNGVRSQPWTSPVGGDLAIACDVLRAPSETSASATFRHAVAHAPHRARPGRTTWGASISARARVSCKQVLPEIRVQRNPESSPLATAAVLSRHRPSAARLARLPCFFSSAARNPVRIGGQAASSGLGRRGARLRPWGTALG